MAKAFAGRSARTVARHCQQVLAGIGFTTEHPLHLSVRRAIVLDQLLGAGTALTRALGTHILSSATLPAAFVAAAAASVVLERVFFRRFYRASDLEQCLLTIGIVFVSIAAAAYIYGTDQQPLQLPSYLRGSFTFAGLNFAVYRLFLIAIALVITIALVAGIESTRFGAQVRAAVNNQRMARGLGINVDVLFAITFALGSGLAGLGGALAVAMVGLDPSFAFTYLIYVLIVVSVGGLGSIAGSFAAAMVLGISDIAGKYYVPAVGSMLIYLVMIVLLMWRPLGLFGRR